MQTKICIICGQELPLNNEYFATAKQNKDGFNGKCKECLKKYRAGHYQKNKEEYSKYAKGYYQKNKEAIKDNVADWKAKNPNAMSKWRECNKEHISEYSKNYKINNIDRVKKWQKNWYELNKEASIKKALKKRRENPEPHRTREQQRRALKRKLPNTLTIKQWAIIKKDFNNECAYCGITENEHIEKFGHVLHQEHFIPISEGGEYTHNNIIPSCISCNSSKRDKNFFEWYPTYEHYNKKREKFILEYLGYTEDTQQLSIL